MPNSTQLSTNSRGPADATPSSRSHLSARDQPPAAAPGLPPGGGDGATNPGASHGGMAPFALEQVLYAFSYDGEPVSMPGSVCGQLTPDDCVVPAGSGKFVIPCARMHLAAFSALCRFCCWIACICVTVSPVPAFGSTDRHWWTALSPWGPLVRAWIWALLKVPWPFGSGKPGTPLARMHLAKASDWAWVAPGAKVLAAAEDPPQATASRVMAVAAAASAPARSLDRLGRPRGPGLSSSFMAPMIPASTRRCRHAGEPD